MKAKEKLYYLITNYLKGKYSTRAFAMNILKFIT